MKKIPSVLLFSLFFFALNGQVDFSETPEIITSDIDLFWECYDAAKPKFKSNHFERYLAEGSEGVQGFIPMRIESAKKLAKKVKAKQAYYEHIRPNSLEIKETFAPAIAEVFESMKAWYPPTVYPTTYFVIGRLNTGGTAKQNGIIMGAEMFGEQQEGDRIKANIDFQIIPAIVAHEMIHYQQNLPRDPTLLSQTIREGSADFLAYLIRDEKLNHYLDDWALPKSKMLWKKFQEQMDRESYKGWLYGGKRPLGWPQDLGYWMGFQITKAYYLKQPDKKQAVHDILNIKDYKQFLRDSGYK